MYIACQCYCSLVPRPCPSQFIYMQEEELVAMCSIAPLCSTPYAPSVKELLYFDGGLSNGKGK